MERSVAALTLFSWPGQRRRSSWNFRWCMTQKTIYNLKWWRKHFPTPDKTLRSGLPRMAVVTFPAKSLHRLCRSSEWGLQAPVWRSWSNRICHQRYRWKGLVCVSFFSTFVLLCIVNWMAIFPFVHRFLPCILFGWRETEFCKSALFQQLVSGRPWRFGKTTCPVGAEQPAAQRPVHVPHSCCVCWGSDCLLYKPQGDSSAGIPEPTEKLGAGTVLETKLAP